HAPPRATRRPPMLGTPYREVNHGGAGRNLHARHGSASLRDAPLGSPRAAHRAETRAAGPRRSVSHGRARKFRPARSIDRRVTGRSTADHMYQKRIDGVVESGGPSLSLGHSRTLRCTASFNRRAANCTATRVDGYGDG